MAIHTDLAIYKACYELLSLSTDLVKNMPRDFKASMGRKIHEECIDMLVLVARANIAKGTGKVYGRRRIHESIQTQGGSMIGATAKAEQFMDRSGSESTKGSRKGYSLLGGGENPANLMTPFQDRQNRLGSLRSKLRALHAEATKVKEAIVANRFKKNRAFFDAVERKAKLAVEITELQSELTNIKAEYLAQPQKDNVHRHFVDICRERLTKAQFRSILEEAQLRAGSRLNGSDQ